MADRCMVGAARRALRTYRGNVVSRLLVPTSTLVRYGLASGYRRETYLVVTLAVATAAWLALAAMTSPFLGGDTGGTGITISNGSQNSAPLPLRYARRIEAVPGVHDVTWMTFQLVNCGTAKPVIVALNAYGGPGVDAYLSTQNHIGAKLLARWQKDPEGILIAKQTLVQCGWHVGQGITPPAMTMSSQHVALHVTGTFKSKHASLAFAHYDYINRTGSMGGKDTVFFYRAHAADARRNNALAARIETAFANDFPTVSATTDATHQSALSRFGKVQQLLAFVMGAILLCTASVLVSVLAHHAAERRRRLALLQTLGFRRGTLFTAFLVETVLVMVLGAALGTALGHELARLPLFGHAIIVSTGFSIPHWAFYWIPVWLAALLVVALAWPAAVIARVKPSDYRAI